jgi:hypothetical protein
MDFSWGQFEADKSEVSSTKMSGVMKCGLCFGALGEQYMRDE